MSAAAMSMLAGTGLQMIGSMINGEAQYKAAQYNAKVARQNAILARQQAANEAIQINRQGRQFLGEQRVAYAASGVTAEGSAYDILQQTASMVKRDELNAKYQGELRARSLESQAQMSEYQGRVARMLGYFGAASSGLQGAGNYYKESSTNSGGSYYPGANYGNTVTYNAPRGSYSGSNVA